jgi:hypothetical protein
LKVHLHYFSKIKSQIESQNSRIQGLSYYFLHDNRRSGSKPLTSGSRSGSGRPKNTGIWWIRIRIRNTGSSTRLLLSIFLLLLVRDQGFQYTQYTPSSSIFLLLLVSGQGFQYTPPSSIFLLLLVRGQGFQSTPPSSIFLLLMVRGQRFQYAPPS